MFLDSVSLGYGDGYWGKYNSCSSSVIPAMYLLDMGADVRAGNKNSSSIFLDGVPFDMGTNVGIDITVVAALYFLLGIPWI